ncbi:hypothetical protein RJ641_032467 [Dillenia turbinata]|uniref:Uncharacterized protein n=1 Tax=Dillenia turbinata TaxID=194707 RepID=A0AAN8VWA9_9MAGN
MTTSKFLIAVLLLSALLLQLVQADQAFHATILCLGMRCQVSVSIKAEDVPQSLWNLLRPVQLCAPRHFR